MPNFPENTARWHKNRNVATIQLNEVTRDTLNAALQNCAHCPIREGRFDSNATCTGFTTRRTGTVTVRIFDKNAFQNKVLQGANGIDVPCKLER